MTALIPLSSKPTMGGGLLNSCLLHGIPFTPPENTTLNQKHGIHHNTAIPSGLMPKIQYFAIGNRARSNSLIGDGIPIQKELPHSCVDAGLYGHVPFVLRAQGNDLADDVKAKYGLRVPYPVTTGGVTTTYWAYFLRRFNNPDTPLTAEIKKIVTTDPDTDPTVTAFLYNDTNLNPTPPVIPNNGVLTSNGIYYSVSVPLSLTMDATDIDEYLNVAEILYGSRDAGVINELALVAGYRASVPLLDINKAPTAGFYYESLRSVITNFISMNVYMNTINGELKLNIDSGITEPDLGVSG